MKNTRMAVFAGCVGPSTSEVRPAASEPEQGIQTLTLQYRISMDAVTPSQFVALYDNGMTMGLKIHWTIDEEEKKKLDSLLAQLERDGMNGKEFTAKAKWIHEGFELEVFKIERKF